MRLVTLTLVRDLVGRIRGEAGMTIVETMVAAVILTAGVLGVFVMVETADKVNQDNRGREAATSLAREVLEKARSTAFADIGNANWLDGSLAGLEGGTGTVNGSTNDVRTAVTRRDVTYDVHAVTCSVDDSKDGLKTSTAGGMTWCADSTGTGTGDSQPEDLKRVGVTTSWEQNGKQFSIYQAATFSSAGSVVGPNLTEFKITQPAGLETETAPTITTNPSGGNMIFRATSIGAADMKFTVDGVPQSSGVAAAGSGSWTLTWNVAALTDGVYTIGATAVDALGTHGDPQYIQVTLARGAPTPLTNITGGYNDVYVAGVKTRVVELGWDAAPEGSVTGYEVSKGATVVCAASLLVECMDLNAASSGSTTYTIKTLYTDASGNTGSLSADYTVTAPVGTSGTTQSFWHASTTAISQTRCYAPTGSQGNTGGRRDAPGTAPAGAEATWTNSVNGNNFVGCVTPFTTTTPMTASTTGMTVSGYFRNLHASRLCRLSWQVFKNGSLLNGVAGNGYGGGAATAITIPANTTNPTQFTATLGTTAQTFISGDQLSIIISGFAQSASSNTCTSTTMYYNSTARPARTTLPIAGGSGGAGTITRPAAPGSLTATALGNGTTKLTWTAPAGSPAADFYRIYRDDQNYTERVDTAGDSGTTPIEWIDADTGGTTHVYRVTAVSSVLAESDPAGPLTQ